MADCFVNHISENVEVFKHPCTRKEFKQILRGGHVKAGTVNLHNDKIYFNIEDKLDSKLKKHFITIGTNSLMVYQNEKPLDPEIWEKTCKRLMLESHRVKNVDVRHFFKFKNNFLVKKFFTFGLRKVAEGTIHLYQLTNASLLLYTLKEKAYVPPIFERLFREMDSTKFNLSILNPNTSYVLGPGTIYTIISIRKCLFSVDICTSLPNYMTVAIPETIPQSIPQAIPMATQEMIPEMIPEATPEMIPEAAPEMIPETILTDDIMDFDKIFEDIPTKIFRPEPIVTIPANLAGTYRNIFRKEYGNPIDVNFKRKYGGTPIDLCKKKK